MNERKYNFEETLEFVKSRYATTVDNTGRNFFHHLTSVARIAEKIYETHQSKGITLNKINFDYIDLETLKVCALLHSVLQDEILDLYLLDEIFGTMVKDVIHRFTMAYGHYPLDFSNPSDHYAMILLLADIRLHTDILNFDEFESAQYNHIRHLYVMYTELISAVK